MRLMQNETPMSCSPCSAVIDSSLGSYHVSSMCNLLRLIKTRSRTRTRNDRRTRSHETNARQFSFLVIDKIMRFLLNNTSAPHKPELQTMNYTHDIHKRVICRYIIYSLNSFSISPINLQLLSIITVVSRQHIEIINNCPSVSLFSGILLLVWVFAKLGVQI